MTRPWCRHPSSDSCDGAAREILAGRGPGACHPVAEVRAPLLPGDRRPDPEGGLPPAPRIRPPGYYYYYYFFFFLLFLFFFLSLFLFFFLAMGHPPWVCR